jgi:hypothetical protein
MPIRGMYDKFVYNLKYMFSMGSRPPSPQTIDAAHALARQYPKQF